MGANEKREATGYTPDTDRVQAAAVDGALITKPEFNRWLETIRAEAKAEALAEVADHLELHPQLRKTQTAWLYYPEHMAAKEKTFKRCAEIIRTRANQYKEQS